MERAPALWHGVAALSMCAEIGEASTSSNRLHCSIPYTVRVPVSSAGRAQDSYPTPKPTEGREWYLVVVGSSPTSGDFLNLTTRLPGLASLFCSVTGTKVRAPSSFWQNHAPRSPAIPWQKPQQMTRQKAGLVQGMPAMRTGLGWGFKHVSVKDIARVQWQGKVTERAGAQLCSAALATPYQIPSHRIAGDTLPDP